MIVIGIALLMSLVGLSPALGTFLAGVVLANSEYRHELESDIDPFKGLLLGLFFITVGASIDFALLSGNFAVVLGLTLGLIVLKAAVLYALGLVFGLKGADRWLFALGLAQAGEFGFVLLAFTVANAVIPAAIADQLLLVVALSMLLTPALFILFDRVIAPRFSVDAAREADAIPETSNIIIAGHGRVGGIVNRMLRGAGFKTTVIDYSSAQLEMLRTFGLHVYYGDATRPDLLAAAGIDKARLLVVAINDKQQITELVRYVIKTYPDVHVMARAVDRHHVYELWGVGCRDVIRETYDSSIRMGRSAYEAMGVPHEAALEITAAFEQIDRKAMREVADLYDPDIPPLENEPYIRRVRELNDEWEAQLLGHMQDVMDRHTPKRA
jgi:CPA2 family monovalent cation:H+ antiporter-2